MKNNPVNLITEEDLKQASGLENLFANKKDKKDERRKKATGKASIISWGEKNKETKPSWGLFSLGNILI